MCQYLYRDCTRTVLWLAHVLWRVFSALLAALQWFTSYTPFITKYAALAHSLNVEMFSIGMELVATTGQVCVLAFGLPTPMPQKTGCRGQRLRVVFTLKLISIQRFPVDTCIKLLRSCDRTHQHMAWRFLNVTPTSKVLPSQS